MTFQEDPVAREIAEGELVVLECCPPRQRRRGSVGASGAGQSLSRLREEGGKERVLATNM